MDRLQSLAVGGYEAYIIHGLGNQSPTLITQQHDSPQYL